MIAGTAVPLANRFGYQDAIPLIYIGFALLLFWLSADAFSNAPMRTVRREDNFVERFSTWIVGFGGHAIVALVCAALAGAGYNVARSVWHSARQQAEERERLRFDVEPYTGPLLEARETGSNLRERPIRDDELASPVRETIAGEDFNVTGQVSQPDGLWYQLQLSDGRTAYIKATRTVERPPERPPQIVESPYEAPPPPPPPPTYYPPPPPPPRVYYPPPPPPPIIYEPVRTHTVLPEYPARALRRDVEGSVAIGFTIFENGSTGNFYVIDESPSGYGFAESTLNAIRQWRYRPRMVDGHPVRHRVVEEIPFVLQEGRR